MQHSYVRRLRLPQDEAHYIAAWEWTQQRPHLYPATGGKMSQAQYLARAEDRTQGDFGVFIDDNLHSLITVVMEGDGEYNFHLTSQPKPQFDLIRAALFTVGEKLFLDLNATLLYTWIPRLFTRNRRLATLCGMRSLRQATQDGILYDIHGITQAEYLEQYGKQRPQNRS